MRGGRIPSDLVEDVWTVELCELFHCLPSQLDEEDKHEIDKLLAIKRALNRWHTHEAKSQTRTSRRR